MSTLTSTPILNDVKDIDWVRQCLFVPYRNPNGGNARDSAEFQHIASLSYASLMFEDTSLGGNEVMNPKPQPCRFSDPKVKSIIAQVDTNLNYIGKGTDRIDKTKTFGMGEWYADTINRNKQVITLQAGTPSFNSLTNFFTGFYDPYHADAVNTGRIGNNFGFNIGQFIGYVTMWSISIPYTVLSFAYSTGKKIYSDLARRPLSKFYYVKPTMALYWGTVQGIVNAMVVNLKQQGGLTPGDLKTKSGAKSDTEADPATALAAYKDYNNGDLEVLGQLLPDLYLSDTGGFSVYGIASRYERMADAHQRRLQKIFNDNKTLDEVNVAIQSYFNNGLQNSDFDKLNNPTLKDLQTAYKNSVAGKGKFLSDKLIDNTTEAPPLDANKTPDNSASLESNANTAATSNPDQPANKVSYSLFDEMLGYKDYLEGELRDGSAFVSFTVDYERHASESFSNGTKESEIAATMNSTARSSREHLFSFANGNIGDGLVASSVEAFLGFAADVVQGAADALSLSGLAMLGGRAFVDIPEFWDNSTVSLNSTTYTIPLRSWSGHPIALLQNIYIPLAMWLALASPRSTGRASYSSPYYVKLWQKGYAQIQTGIVTQLSITRGTGNLGWNAYGQPIAIDLSVTVTDLSKIMHIPITADLSIKDMLSIKLTGYAASMFDEDTKFTDLMAVYTSLGLSDQYYPLSRWRIRNQRAQMNFDSFFSMDHLMTTARDTLPGNILSAFVKGNYAGR